MLLTITYSGQNTAELGYLLHKNPFRPQRFDLSYGAAYVFYPHVSEPVSPPIEKTTAAILLDINPVDLARGKTGSGGVDYVNDRPYAASSFLSVAIAKVFGTAMGGRADNHQTLSDSPLDLDADIAMLPCRGNPAMIKRVFEPLGYEVSWESFDADENFPSWGKSDYVNLKIKGKIRLRDLLKHIYVLIPVFDRQKHYYIGEDEVEKLLRYAEDWLPSHPEREYITGRYLKRLRPLVNKAFARLVCADERSGELADDGEASVEMTECKLNLNAQRLDSVIAELKRSDANSVIDIGCGEGNLLRLLVKERRFARIG
ncbi:MAG: 3' terminal RNA ribose 2'-O-methyltransferase Hen1, partial [Treponema sp.]|nr:3' terminal RNA ribose 2'-O-methyltransferase Hen1 [Treponema sp.]